MAIDQAPAESLEYNECEEAVKRLNDFLSRELAPEEEVQVQQHLKDCNGCFQKFRFEETLLRRLRDAVGQVQAPDGLRQRIQSLLHRSH
jgi:anti-sigma factor (TIGR02949 family)